MALTKSFGLIRGWPVGAGRADGAAPPPPLPWSPTDLGVDLRAWWDADRADLITQSSGQVSSWRDVVGGYDAVQATSTARPTWDATSFAGRAGLTFDGTDDELTMSMIPFPSGSTGGEIWALLDQQALGSSSGSRYAVTYGKETNNLRGLRRVVDTGVNRMTSIVGNGSAINSAQNNAVDFSGIHVARGVTDPTSTRMDVDGTVGTPVPIVAATMTTRLRIGATSSDVPVAFWRGQIAAVLITNLLSDDDAAQMVTYLKARGGIA